MVVLVLDKGGLSGSDGFEVKFRFFRGRRFGVRVRIRTASEAILDESFLLYLFILFLFVPFFLLILLSFINSGFA